MSTSEPQAPPPVPPAVQALAVAHLGPGARVLPLAGDASSRVYFRATAAGGRSAVVAAHDAPFEAAGFPFLETSRLLADAGVPVPAVLKVDGAAGLILLEDLGDGTLQMEVGETPAVAAPPAPGARRGSGAAAPRAPERAGVEHLYRQAVEIIVRLQRQGTPRLHPGLHAGREALDADRFRFELDYMLDNLVIGLRGRPLDASTRRDLGAALDDFCTELERQPQVLCHRDFHSRNLMVRPGGRLAVVDHQDARRGPDTYDLASLLRDPYVIVPEDRVERMLAHHLAATGSAEPATAFRHRFERMAVQRTLKAAGTFAAQQVLHGRDRYLRYLPRVLALARRSLAICPELGRLRSLLGALVPELGGHDKS